MTEKEFRELDRGDIIKHITDYHLFVVDANYGGRVTAVATVDMTNPSEWAIVKKCNRGL
ncbi:hypothetical protein ES707_05438 [subsurface metagenome]|jgi:hypothetical protein